MKKLLLLLLLGITLFGSDIELATKIYLAIAKEATDQSNPKFYLHGKISALRNNPSITVVSSCEEADIVIVDTMKDLPANANNKFLFATRYKIFKNNSEVFGAFFWQKGRPNIIFDADRLRKLNITLGPSFQKYVE